MERFKLTTKVSDLKVGDVFWFSGEWARVWWINDFVYYCPANYIGKYINTITIDSKMLVVVKDADQ